MYWWLEQQTQNIIFNVIDLQNKLKNLFYIPSQG